MVRGAEDPAEADNVVEDCCPSAPIHKQISPAIGRNRELRIIKGLLEARTSIRPDRHCERRWRVKNGCDGGGEFRVRPIHPSFLEARTTKVAKKHEEKTRNAVPWCYCVTFAVSGSFCLLLRRPE